ncbi:conserved Plasmodium protein, unknown function [Plasmodium knowlesi strain H]|uniref:Mic1 domain-containing protein n=3 Tax=Plasmodium knowlesi TaxID=5850 RepID=A0A5K1VID2_PLAKH|nr:conserved Plasmodium protein, unknown function [Plasmodium knowlesi strain H]OTN63721.1 Uncharacterized protein PKNOH_S140263900 [Plasmodium knowlesi]CAA9991053.1 conserved Plasmodium protein, unknown function [Plasmodium knowlesi strain H]SBO21083.1 conserved Plasmodium protein, unknown function [Plasmodium knowlesi strain H]VVS80527.1 conserved Plasmodium protein, unknown function [Plasmodium knowlesi strain H]|eukprot:XP_002262335.1 hypothetical protein, conserved in Plasmodium species [Plasmodium knowlesi strain H]
MDHEGERPPGGESPSSPDKDKCKEKHTHDEFLAQDSNERSKRIIRKTKRNGTISAYSPAQISEPVYQWEVSSNDRVFYDKMNDLIIHQNVAAKALLVTDIKKMKENYQAVYVKFDSELCEHITFAPNNTFFLYHSTNPNRIQISDILNNHNIYLSVCISNLSECKILATFWLHACRNEAGESNTGTSSPSSPTSTASAAATSSADFAVVTNQGVEIFHLSFDNLTITPLKKHVMKSEQCWYDEKSSYIALLSSTHKTHVIFPYLLNNSNAIKLQKIELNTPKGEPISKNDIEIITLYDETYCIHKDYKNGRISFRCLSSSLSFDYVLDLFCNGVFETFSVDNIFGVFNYANEKVYLYDVKYQKKRKTNFITSLSEHISSSHTINIAYLTSPKEFRTHLVLSHISFHPFNVLMDNQYGNVYKIRVDYDLFMLQICQHFANLNTSVDVLLRRPNCKKRITEMFFLSLENDIQIEDFLTIVNIINLNYRKLIEQSAKKRAPLSVRAANHKIIQPVDDIIKNLGNKTLITERDIVTDVFHSFMIKKYGLDRKETLFNFSLNFRQMEKAKRERKRSIGGRDEQGDRYMEKYRIRRRSPENVDGNAERDRVSPRTEESTIHEEEYRLKLSYSELQSIPMFLLYVLEYMKSLLMLNIIPNRILQTFLFDICIFYEQDNCLRQLLQFYVIADSVEVTKRLFHYWKLTQHTWAYQLCLDMSLRLGEYEMVLHLFLSANKYIKIIDFIRKHNLIDYPIAVILQAIENDFDSPDKYIILNHVLSSLTRWIHDSDRDPEKYPLPNLQNCEKWVTLVEE